MPQGAPFPTIGPPVDRICYDTGMTQQQAIERYVAVQALHPYIYEPMGVQLGRHPDTQHSWGVGLHLFGKHDGAEVAPLAEALTRFAAEFTVDDGLTVSATNHQTAWAEHANGFWPVKVAIPQVSGRGAGPNLFGFKNAEHAALFSWPSGPGFPPITLVTRGTLRGVLEVVFAEARSRDEQRRASR